MGHIQEVLDNDGMLVSVFIVISAELHAIQCYCQEQLVWLYGQWKSDYLNNGLSRFLHAYPTHKAEMFSKFLLPTAH